MTARAMLAAMLWMGAALATSGPTWAQGRESRSRDNEYRLTPQPLSIDLISSGVYDSNIDHMPEELESLGVEAAIDARLRSSGRYPLFTLVYEGSVQRFSGTERWDRLRHELEARIAKRLGPVTLETTGEVALRGATEDRELGNQYTVKPRVAVRVASTRLRLYAAYRLKQFEIADAAGNGDAPQLAGIELTEFGEERIRSAGAEFRFRIGGSSRWELGYRYEESDSDDPNRRYVRRRYTGEYRADFTDRDFVELGLEYRPRLFPDRLVEVESVDESTGEIIVTEEPRQDFRWVPYASASHTFPWGQKIELEYEFQRRTSNDPDKEFEAHRLTLTVRLPLVSRYKKTQLDQRQ